MIDFCDCDFDENCSCVNYKQDDQVIGVLMSLWFIIIALILVAICVVHQ